MSCVFIPIKQYSSLGNVVYIIAKKKKKKISMLQSRENV